MTSQKLSRILVAVDDSPAGLAAVHVAVGLAAESRARLRFVNVIGDGELVRALARLEHDGPRVAARSAAAESLLRHVGAEAQRAGVQAETASLTGEPAALLLVEARDWKADLVVMGRSDVPGVGRPYVGKVTREVLELSAVPVMVVPQSA